MKVTVKLYATLADYLPPGTRHNRVEVEVPEAAAVDAVLQPFSLPPKLTHLVLLNGTYVAPAARATTCLAEGDVLAVWPPIAGG
jgi:molybdopterin converting factor small subunit